MDPTRQAPLRPERTHAEPRARAPEPGSTPDLGSAVESDSSKREPAPASPDPAPAAGRADAGRADPARGRRRRVAVVGAGFIADFHLAILRATEGVEVVAVCDPDAGRARALAERYGVPRVVARVDELSDRDVDVAHLLVPPDVHVAVARSLIERGIGVFAEKPLALESREARELAALAEMCRVPLGVNHNNLHHPAFVRLQERVRRGDVGRVVHVRATLSVPLLQLEAGDFAHWMFRAPRNIVFEQAVHPLCQVHSLVGRVKGAQTTFLGTRELFPGQVFHDRWSVAAVGERGTAEIHLAFGQGFTRSTLEVFGTDGALEADLFRDQLSGERKSVYLDFFDAFLAVRGRARELARGAWRVLFQYGRFTLGLGRREDAFFAGMRTSIEAFYGALARGTALPTDAVQAAEVLEWCEAVARGVSGEAATERRLPEPKAARPREVLVLGATGFIGRRVVAKLAERGLPVTVLARRRHSLPSEIAERAEKGEIRFLTGGLEDQAALERALLGVDTVVHLATGAGDTWEKVERSMVHGTRALAELAIEKRVRRFVYVSSIAALDTGDRRTVHADDFELDPRPEARSIYARGKIAAERALLELARTGGLPLVVVRPGVVLGEGTALQHSGFGLWARDNHCVGWGAGDHPLPIVWVDDVADAIARVVSHPGDDLAGRALNLCARTPLTAREMVAELRSVTGRDLHFHPRSLVLSQTLEIGKWIVKKVGGRKDAEFPSWRDLKARSLASSFPCATAREMLGWKPVEEREALLDRTVRIYKARR